MNNLILYAIIIVIIYHLFLKKKEGYIDNKNEELKKLIEEYKLYSNETNLTKKKQLENNLLNSYEAFKQRYPDVFENGISDDIMRMI